MSKPITKAELLNFLRENNLATLATVSPHRKPEAASVFVHISDNFEIFFVTKTETKKYMNIRENENIALVFTKLSEMKTVQMSGVVRPVGDHKAQMEMLETISEETHHRYSFSESPVEQIRDGQLVVVRVELEWMRYADFDGITGEPEHFQNIAV